MNYDLRVLSLGAGVQSSTLFLMALEGVFPEPLSFALFADTQWEPPPVYDTLNTLDHLSAGRIPIYRITAGNLRQDVLDALDTPKISHLDNPPFFVRNTRNDGTTAEGKGGMLWRKCTQKYKIRPIQQTLRHRLGYQPRQRIKKRVQQWLGISLDEAHRMKDSRVPWIDNYYPLIEKGFSRKDCIQWLKEQGYPIPRRSACIGCPMHSNATWAAMRDQWPDEWTDVVDFDARLRQSKLPGVTGDAYVHWKMLPLPEAVLATGYNPDQTDLFLGFGNECEGVCGV